MSSNRLSGLTREQLETLKTNTLANINKQLVLAKSWSGSGRTFDMPSIQDDLDLLGEINLALVALGSTTNTGGFVYADLSV